MIIDTHCHVYMADYDEDRAEVMDRAAASGVGLIVLPGVDVESVERMLTTNAQWPDRTVMAVGLHPTEVKGDTPVQEQLEFVNLELICRPGRYAAIGEIGMDLYQDTSLRAQQREAFATQLGWAAEYNLPVLIHNRNALDDTLDVMATSRKPAGAVFHCFGGSAADVDRIRKAAGDDAYFGIGGIVTFKNSNLREVLPHIGLERIVLETDAPWLAPVPYRGKRNESGYLPLVVKTIATALGVTPQEVEDATTANALRLLQRNPVRS